MKKLFLIVMLIFVTGGVALYMKKTKQESRVVSVDGEMKSLPEQSSGAPSVVESIPVNALESIPKDIRTLSGKVSLVEDGRITLDVRLPLSKDGDPVDTRVAVVSGSTKVEKIMLKDKESMRREAEAFIAASKNRTDASEPVSAPDAFMHVSASLTDVVAGSIIRVTASDNIWSAKEIQATNVEIIDGQGK